MFNNRAPKDRRFHHFSFNIAAGQKPGADTVATASSTTHTGRDTDWEYSSSSTRNRPDDDEVDREVQKVFFESARDLLPDIPASKRLLDEISNIDHRSLATVDMLSVIFKDRYSDNRLFNLMAAALLRYADNGDSVAYRTNDKVSGIFDELQEVDNSYGQPNQYSAISRLSKDARNVLFANIVADLSIYREALLENERGLMQTQNLKSSASHIIRCANDTFNESVDEYLLMTTVSIFNEVSELAGNKLRIGMRDNGSLFMTSDDPPSHRGGKKGPRNRGGGPKGRR